MSNTLKKSINCRWLDAGTRAKVSGASLFSQYELWFPCFRRILFALVKTFSGLSFNVLLDHISNPVLAFDCARLASSFQTTTGRRWCCHTAKACQWLYFKIHTLWYPHQKLVPFPNNPQCVWFKAAPSLTHAPPRSSRRWIESNSVRKFPVNKADDIAT